MFIFTQVAEAAQRLKESETMNYKPPGNSDMINQ